MTDHTVGIREAMAAVRGERPVTLLQGYLDREADPPRLYAGLDLSVYVELDGILATQPGPDPAAPALVWVAEGTPLKPQLSGKDPFGSALAIDPETLFAPGPDVDYLARCAIPRITSHTIGWCAND